jgi:hypothetical protein
MKDFQEGCPMQNAIIYLMTKKANKQFQRCIKDKISQKFSFFPEREREIVGNDSVGKDSYLVKHGTTGKHMTKSSSF